MDRNCYACKHYYYKDEYCENLELQPCYPSKGCGDFSKREALEREPILNKIRAEIEQAADKQFQIAMGVSDLNERYAHIQMENAYRHCLNVIDNYKAEVEPQESEDKE